jgi:hypothetical protein
MADKDLGEGLEKFEEEVENLKNKQFKIFGIKVTAITVSAFLALAGSFVGTLYGGFIVYKDYMDMKEIISNIDTDEIAARNEQIEIKLEEAISYTRDIKSDLRDDVHEMERLVERLEDKTDKSEDRVKDAQSSIEAMLESVLQDMNTVQKDVTASIREVEAVIRQSEKDVRSTMRETEDRIDADMKSLEKEMKEKLEEALDNPLNDMQ